MFISKYTKFLPYVAFLFITIFFNFSFFNKIIASSDSQDAYVTDGTITELIAETGYQNIINGKNPFERLDTAMYPFGINFALNDPGISNSFLFLIIRPFFSISKSIIFIQLLNLYVSTVCMYWLLKKFKVTTGIATVLALAYGFMPFVSHRLLGHYTYTALYLFPLTTLLVYNFLQEKRTILKFLITIGIGFMVGWSLYSNFYYFLMIGMSICLFGIWALIAYKKMALLWLKNNFSYALVAGVSFLAFISPWIIATVNFFRFENRATVEGFGGAIHYSADLLSFFIPNQYNPVYYKLISLLSLYIPIFSKIKSQFLFSWDRFVYPGLIILACYFGLLFASRKKMKLKIKKQIAPFLYISIFFLSLTLGPFLKLFGKWTLYLDGVAVVVPLPFLLLHYIPGLESIRVPGRFIPIFIFYALIVCGIVLQSLYKKLKKSQRIYFIVLLFGVFLFDQVYQLPTFPQTPVPIKIYQKIATDPIRTTVLEIPFTVRDGFKYIGFVHGISPMQGILTHSKPVMGGYFARVDDAVFNYYANLQFLGYIAKITDKGNYNPLNEQPLEPNVFPHNLKLDTIKTELNFFNIKYIILKTDEKYSTVLSETINDLGAQKIMEDRSYTLYSLPADSSCFDSVQFGTSNDTLFSASGLSDPQNDFRAVIAQSAKIFIENCSQLPKNVILNMSSIKNRRIEVYLNEKYLTSVLATQNKTEFIVPVNNLKPGINTVFLKILDLAENEALDLNTGLKVYSLELKEL